MLVEDLVEKAQVLEPPSANKESVVGGEADPCVLVGSIKNTLKLMPNVVCAGDQIPKAWWEFRGIRIWKFPKLLNDWHSWQRKSVSRRDEAIRGDPHLADRPPDVQLLLTTQN